MEIKEKRLKGFKEIILEPHKDNRGFLVSLYDKEAFKEHGLNTNWIQTFHSHTEKANTIRGLYGQLSSFSEAKVIKAINGKMLWVVVDLRKDSETFGQWDSIILSNELGNMVYVENGFANGCFSLTDNVDLIIKTDNLFSYEYGFGIKWSDSDLNIDWPTKESIIISDKDNNYPSFNNFKEKYGGL